MHILALHGFTGRGSDFHPLSKVCGSDWHCPDLPGHGLDPKLDCTPEATVALINQTLSSLHSPITASPDIILGYSMGARAALLHATQHPEAWKALILISPNPGIEEARSRAARRQADEALAKIIENGGVPNFLDCWQETPLIRAQKNLPADIRESMQSSRLEHTTAGLASSLRQFGQGSLPNLWEQLHKLRMPVCVISGKLDTKYSRIADRIKAEIGDECRHISIANTSHAPHFEASAIFARHLQEFMSEL